MPMPSQTYPSCGICERRPNMIIVASGVVVDHAHALSELIDADPTTRVVTKLPEALVSELFCRNRFDGLPYRVDGCGHGHRIA